MEYRICIPSKGRVGLCSTQKVFKSGIFYVPESEVENYKQAYKNEVVGVPLNVKGITKTRNYILKNENNDVFFIDDDFEYGGYLIRNTEKCKVIRITNENVYINEINKMFELANQLKSKLIGFFTTGNNLTNYPYSPFLLNGVALGSCMGIINDGTYYFDESFEVKEDYELSLRNIADEKTIVRSNILFMQHEHTQLKGGCRDSNRILKEKQALIKLNEMYPGMIKSAKHRGSSFAIQINY